MYFVNKLRFFLVGQQSTPVFYMFICFRDNYQEYYSFTKREQEYRICILKCISFSTEASIQYYKFVEHC